jgi:hypothetical protein
MAQAPYMLLLFNMITHGFEEWSSPPLAEDFIQGLLFQEQQKNQ